MLSRKTLKQIPEFSSKGEERIFWEEDECGSILV